MRPREQRSREPKRPAAEWWSKHRKAMLSAAGALGLLLVAAIVSPLGGRVVELVWPTGGLGGGGQPPPTGPAPGARLVALQQWPATYNEMCEGSTKVAGVPGSRPLSELTTGQNRDVRLSALEELGAVIWYHGKLLVTLTTVDSTPLLIMAMETVIFDKKAIVPSWGLEVSPGCGGPSQMRTLRAVLDRESIEDLGVSEYGPGNPNAPSQPFGPSFTVSNADAADVLIEVNACDGFYEFGIRISYVEAGEQLTAWVGSADKPLRIVGGWRGVERFHVMAGSETVGIQPGPMPLYPGGPVSEGVPSMMEQLCT